MRSNILVTPPVDIGYIRLTQQKGITMLWGLVGPVVLLLVGGGFVLWDRRSPVSTSPDMRLVWIGGVLAGIGAVSSFFLWWLIVPVIVLLVGASLIVIGRHRVVSAA
jgi:hypothetical protein